MNYISIIKPVDLLPKLSANGDFLKPILYVLIPVWIIGSFFIFLVSLFMHNFFGGFLSIISSALGFALIKILFSGGRYLPGKSFYFHRLPKEKIQMIYIFTAVVTIFIVVVASLFDYRMFFKYFISIVIGLGALYYTYLSFKFHEDVDYVTNNEMSELLGMEIDEKVQASYQNFSTKPSKGSNMMLLTDKKIIFAFYNGTQWFLANKKLNDICKIGKVSRNGVHYLYVGFVDRTSVGLHMKDYDKPTSNPILFFKKFLITFDTLLLGKTDQKIASRRRISVNNSMPKPPVYGEKNMQSKNRTIDISNTVVENLREAVPVESGRVLEF